MKNSKSIDLALLFGVIFNLTFLAGSLVRASELNKNLAGEYKLTHTEGKFNNAADGSTSDYYRELYCPSVIIVSLPEKDHFKADRSGDGTYLRNGEKVIASDLAPGSEVWSFKAHPPETNFDGTSPKDPFVKVVKEVVIESNSLISTEKGYLGKGFIWIPVGTETTSFSFDSDHDEITFHHQDVFSFGKFITCKYGH